MTMATNSSNGRLISDLPLHLFENLVSHPRAIANPIEAAALRQQIISKLQANNADDGTVREILKISPPTLLRILDPCLTYVECNRLISRIHRECAAQPLSALEMMHRTQTASACNDESSPHTPSYVIGKIPTGLPTLDAHLHGGVPIGSITELVGRAGVGKTHLAQQLCVLAAKQDGGAVFIDAEKKLSLIRLREIAFERFLSDQNTSVGQHQHHAHELSQQVLENVTIHPLLTTRELLDTLDQLEKEIILRNSEAALFKQGETTSNASSTRRLPVRLIVVDSVAAPIRRDFDMMGSSSNTAAHRASAIFQIAKRLKQLAYDYQLAVVVVNQAGSGGSSMNQVGSGSSSMRNDSQRNNTLDIRDGEFTASLGTAWQYCVSTRIVLEHEEDPHRLQQEQYGTEGSVRMATLAKSLVSKRTKLPFELTMQGLCEVSPAS
ncbi:hypothetical protein ACHAXR_010633 [Thalassiosira sp. AJA248-18]